MQGSRPHSEEKTGRKRKAKRKGEIINMQDDLMQASRAESPDLLFDDTRAAAIT